MKRSLRRLPNCALVALLITFASSAHALPETEWKYRQGFSVEHTGVLRIVIPLETLDHTQADLRDLRIVGSAGNEVPFALVRSSNEPAHWQTAPTTHVSLQDDATVITVDSAERKNWEAISLVTPSPSFLKPAKLEVSSDGETWETVVEAAPLFRQDGAETTTLDLPKKETRHFRLTLSDRQRKPIIVTAVKLREPATDFTTLEPVEVRIARADDYATETALTLALPAANLDLESLVIRTPEGIFTRKVRAVLRDFEDGEVRERTLATDTLFRLRLDAGQTVEKTRALLPVAVPSRELVLYFENGDSPPLRIEHVDGERRVVYVAFEATAPGRYELWSGNPESTAPRYDLASLSDSLRRVTPSSITFDPAKENLNYQRPDLLAGLTLEGATLNATEWATHRAVQLTQNGVHLLELDLAALSSAEPSLSDLRLIRGAKQVPYILERTKLTRAIELNPTDDPDTKSPNVSRWKAVLPRAGAPINAVELSTTAPLFEREFRVWEKRDTGNGEHALVELGHAMWRRTPQQKQASLVIPIDRSETAQLWITTDNGDNPPVPIARVRAFYPVTRLLFRTETADALSLLAGNPRANAPRYDLALVAPTLVASDKTPATLAADEQTSSTASKLTPPKTVLFWGSLGLVVIALLAVVAKLLPKPPQ